MSPFKLLFLLFVMTYSSACIEKANKSADAKAEVSKDTVSGAESTDIEQETTAAALPTEIKTPSQAKQNLIIYPPSSYQKTEDESTATVILTDAYPFNDHPDSSVIDDAYLGEVDFDEHHTLKEKQRKLFLKTRGIEETDSVYIYNYSASEMRIFEVKDLPLLAHLSPYHHDRPADQYDYMIGFDLEKKLSLKEWKFFYDSFIFVGKENPFSTKPLSAVKWREVDSTSFPSNPQSEHANKNHTIGKTYRYKLDGLQYFIQDLTLAKNYHGRLLRVLDTKNKTILFEKMLFESEGISFTPLNFVSPEDEYIYQWTGKLFKNKAPVIFGFQYHSFDCPAIDFLDATEPAVYIRCDNRH